ncbi:MAG TPA: LacI family DNA-binding transcriptional regulator, partial [Rubrivivax sp.]|nr:LacI family DNA-binding transcriptional regulator [Rubrivivax sp.]
MPIDTPPTVSEVAAAAGVSTATVSRALNLPASVRPALRAPRPRARRSGLAGLRA